MRRLALLSVFLALPAFATDKPLPPGRYVVTQCEAAASAQTCLPFFPAPPPVTREQCEAFMSPPCVTCPPAAAAVQVQPLPVVPAVAALGAGSGVYLGSASAASNPQADTKLKTWQKWLIGGVAVAFVAVVVNNELHDTGSPLPPRKKPCDGGPDCY